MGARSKNNKARDKNCVKGRQQRKNMQQPQMQRVQVLVQPISPLESLSAMSQELFEKTEFVSSDDPNIDQSELVYMGSDSEESCLQQEVREQRASSHDDSEDRNGNPIDVSVKETSKEEVDKLLAILNATTPGDDDEGEYPDVGDLMHNGIETDPIVTIIREEEIYDNSLPFDYGEEVIVKIEPPEGMPAPPTTDEHFKIEVGFDEDDGTAERQFEIVTWPFVVPKDEPEEERKVIEEPPPRDATPTQPASPDSKDSKPPPPDTTAEENAAVHEEPENIATAEKNTAACETEDEVHINGVENGKTEDDAESPNTSVDLNGDMSLVDHPYSQSDKEFCEDLVQDLLKETGNENNPSAVQLLTSFTGLFESFFEEDENAQRSLYFENMKKSLGKLKIKEVKAPKPEVSRTDTAPSPRASTTPGRRSSAPTPSLSVVDLTRPRFAPIQATQSDEVTETIDLTEFDLPPTQPSEKMEDDSLLAELKEVSIDAEQLAESEGVVKLKDQIRRVETVGNKIVDGVKQIKVVNDESIVELQGALSALLKESTKEFRAISAEILANSRAAAEIENRARLVNASNDSLSSESDDERVVKVRRRKQQPAVVSSTKEDSDATDGGGVKVEEVEDMDASESDDSKDLRDPNKEIDKLLDFSTLDHAKAAPSKKVSRQKKLRKVRKRKASSESLLSSSSEESRESSSTENDGEKTDEEEKMRLRQNDNARDDLLADSDVAESEYSDQSGLSVLFSSDDEAATKAKDKPKPQSKKPPVNDAKSSGDETSVSSDDEDKKLANGVKSPPKEEEAVKAKIENDEDKSDTDASGDDVKVKKKRIRRDSDEREIFSKNFLDGTPAFKNIKTSPKSPSKNSAQSPSKRDKNSLDATPGTPPDDKGLIDLTMFHQKRINIDDDMDIFENRTSRNDGAGPSNANKRPAPPPIQEDEFIYLSSDSDSEISVPASGSGTTSTIPKRKKMLSEEELQEETKRAQKEETKRLERLKKKDERLTQLMSQRLSQESGRGRDSGYEELILDYNPKTEVTISVHEKLVRGLKDHQREGIKFMYDTCFGSIGDEVKTESGCILAHCMGLGKTLQLITLLHTLISYPEQLKIKKVIVICPKSTIMNWSEEFGKWLRDIPSRNLKVFYFKDQMVMNDKIKIVESWYDWKAPSVFLVNYESFRYMVHYSGSKRSKIPEPEKAVKEKQDTIMKCLLNPGPDLVVCDEGHIIKNQKSATNRAIVKIKTRRRIVLTGTPVQNNLNEYYSMVDWIKPALLGTIKEFNNLYANPIKDGQHIDSTPQMIKKMKQRSFILNRKLSKFVQRKEVSVLQQYLPQLHQYCLFVPLTEVQEKLYEKFLALNPLDGGHQLLNDYTALRKIWTHPKVLQNAYERAMSGDLKIDDKKKKNRLVDDEDNDEPDDNLDIIHGNTGVKSKWWMQFVSENHLESIMTSNKLLTLFYILRLCQMKKQKCLVFSSFVAVLNVVEYFMKKIHSQRNDPNASRFGYDEFKMNGSEINWINGLDYCRLDGSTKREHRQAMIERFNDTTNTRLRCFLISSKAGGQGINLTGASRCVILDTSWNPSSDQQNIFRIYRLGQKHPCYVYRLIALGTMEEKVYSRSVTKQAMSGRVVDKRQIDRHYKMSELSELYVLTKTDHDDRPSPQMPADEFLKFMLHTYPKQVYKYHDHERLLENKPDQDLNDDEKDEAWKLYEAELSGPPRVAPMAPLLANDQYNPNVMANLNLNFLAAASPSSALDTSGLFSKFFQPPSYFPNDFLTNLLPYDLSGSYRNALNPLATSPGSNLASTSQASAMIRTQLNANLPPPQLYGPFGSPMYNLAKPTTSPKPQSAPRRRPSNTTKASPPNVPKALPRNNGSIIERLSSHELLMDTSAASKSTASPKDGTGSKVVTNSVIQKEPLGSKNSPFDKNAAGYVQPRKLVTVRPNLNIPRPQQAHLASMPSRNSSSPSTLPGTAARTHVTPESSSSAFMKVKSASSLATGQLQPGLLLPNVVPRSNTNDRIYIHPKNKAGTTTAAKQILKNNNPLTITQQRSQPKPILQSRPAISVPAPPIPSGLKPAVKKNQNLPRKTIPMNPNVNRLAPAPKTPEKASTSQQQSPSIQRGFVTQKQQQTLTPPSPISIQSAYSLAKDPLSGSSTSSSPSSILKTLPKQSFIPQNRSSFTPQSKAGASTSKTVMVDQKEQQRKIDQLVAQNKSHIQQKASNFKVVPSNRKPVNGAGPSTNVPKAVENSVSITKIMSRSDPKFVPMPKSLQSTPSGSSTSSSPRTPSQSSPSTTPNHSVSSRSPAQPVIRINPQGATKIQQQTIQRGPMGSLVRTPPQSLAKGPSQIIVPRMSQSNAAGTSNSQPRVQNTQQTSQPSSQHRWIAGIKRKNESPQNPEQATKRFSLGDQTIRVIPRDQRERMLQNTPSVIEDIVEIE